MSMFSALRKRFSAFLNRLRLPKIKSGSGSLEDENSESGEMELKVFGNPVFPKEQKIGDQKESKRHPAGSVRSVEQKAGDGNLPNHLMSADELPHDNLEFKIWKLENDVAEFVATVQRILKIAALRLGDKPLAKSYSHHRDECKVLNDFYVERTRILSELVTEVKKQELELAAKLTECKNLAVDIRTVRAQRITKIKTLSKMDGLDEELQKVSARREMLEREINFSQQEAKHANRFAEALNLVEAKEAKEVVKLPVFSDLRKVHSVETKNKPDDQREIKELHKKPAVYGRSKISNEGRLQSIPVTPAARFDLVDEKGLPEVALQTIKPGEKVYIEENGFTHSYELSIDKTFFSVELHDAPGGWRWCLSTKLRQEYCNYFVQKALEAFAVFNFKKSPADSPADLEIVFPQLHDKVVESMLYEALLAVMKVKNWKIPIILPWGKEESFKDPSVKDEMLKAVGRLTVNPKQQAEEKKIIEQATLKLKTPPRLRV